MSKKFILASILAVALLGTVVYIVKPALAENNSDFEKSVDKGVRAVGSTLEVHINNNGKVLVRGAKITSISGPTITATNTWGSTTMTWIVNTDTSTKSIRRYGGNSSLSEMSVGDYISFSGMLDTTASVLTVKADMIKDWSIQKVSASFTGTVASIDSANQKFGLTTKERGTITVVVASTTQWIKANATSATFGDLKIGGKVLASGVYNNVQKILEAAKVVIYPMKPEPSPRPGTPTPSATPVTQ